MHPPQAEGEQGHPEPPEREKKGYRVRVVELADAVLPLAKAEADRQTDTELSCFAAVALQPGQQQAVEGEQAETDQWMSRRPEAQSGTPGAQRDE